MLAPEGAPASRLKVSVLAGMPGSVALAAKVSRLPSPTDLSPMYANANWTITVVLTSSLHAPSLSWARAKTVCSPTGQVVVSPLHVQPFVPSDSPRSSSPR